VQADAGGVGAVDQVLEEEVEDRGAFGDLRRVDAFFVDF